MLQRLACPKVLRRSRPLPLDIRAKSADVAIRRIIVEPMSSTHARLLLTTSSASASYYYRDGVEILQSSRHHHHSIVSGGETKRRLSTSLSLAAATASLIGLSAAASSSGEEEHRSPSLISFFTNTCRVRCDDDNKAEKVSRADNSNNASHDQARSAGSAEESSESDPYDNLPETDEDTNCSMCNTFRKGPCRPFWRKLERCFKDKENEENGAVMCMRYFSPHQHCLQLYINLYQLVSLDTKQELVRDAELAVRKDERRDWEVDIDWGLWKDFVKEQGLLFKQTERRKLEGEGGGDALLLPLWQRLPENLEPVLLTVSSPLPQQKDNMILKIAYAVDQDGFVLGFAYNQAYQALVEQTTQKDGSGDSTDKTQSGHSSQTTEKPSASDDTKAEHQSQAESTKPSDDTFSLEFFLLPGETQTIRISAMYSENPVTASPKKDLLDVILCTSPAYSVAEGAR